MLGLNKGWIAIGFGNGMIQSDIITFRYIQNFVKTEDRWSETTIIPKLDSDIIGCVSTLTTVDNGNIYDPATGNWNVTFTKTLGGNACNQTFTDKSKLGISIALGQEFEILDKHLNAHNHMFEISSEKLDDQNNFSRLMEIVNSMFLFGLFSFIV
ncbi:hypothetical protein IMG5_166210 [Ichthyophthirius multifiliis]|uniref:DOMON domain-containing protein n=1 Tax=Ichthyophthirius multifiliis TaxID=5932 RepID=G0R0Q4_ICHMU|nr:hypothetical protein IMG5_166210 [Ichthyophthirius multifiliis]EGR28954.1 hypothetical protein IMG5_166210 [Ichthyophthirius multifiliis]|eukprot:XP_004030190.1 hypothetical protein IMG5_166210 [Ichthyophthirius multifiliis]